jgi:TIGR03009 family protein
MRRAGLVASALFATAPLALSQTPAAPMPPGPRPVAAVIPVANTNVAPAVAAHLKAWEAKNKGLGSLYSECEFATKDEVRQRESKYAGSLMCMKPNLAMMRIDNVANKADFKMYVADGQAVHEFLATNKTKTTYKIPPGGKGGVGDNLLMEFMSGSMTADDAIQRFDIKLDKEEDYYVHLKISPRLEKDRNEFDTMILVLYSQKLAERKWDYLPAVCRISKNGGQEIDTWTFKDHKTNLPNITKDKFVAPALPAGWTVETPNSLAGTRPTNVTPPAIPTKR